MGGSPIQLGGDIVTEVDGKPVNGSDDLANLVETKKAGDKVKLTYFRGKDRKSAEITLGKRPANLDQVAPSG